jgi:hypothetical protein
MWSLADALDRLAPAADPALIGATHARLHALAAHLPAALTRVIYLESWIGQPRPRLDLSVKIDPHDRDALAATPGWAQVASFARAWAPGSALDASIRAAWLEFDLDPLTTPDAASRAPRVFVDFTREAQRAPSVDARHALATAVVHALSGAPPPPALRACLAQLPAGGHLAYLGVFDGAIVRVCMGGVADLAAYLAAIGWPGDVAALTRGVLAPLARTQGAPPTTVLHLDLAPDVQPRIGLEYTFPRAGLPGGLPAPDALLDHLVARGWCTARNRAALRAWPRRSVELLPYDLWHSRVSRQIGHVKIAFTPGAPVVAKAYLRTAFALAAGGTVLGGRPQRFGDGARAPSDGGAPPSPAAAALQPRDRPPAAGGTAVAFLGRERRGVTGMTMSTTQQEALEQILTRAAVDLEFRKSLLVDPRRAILDGLGLRIPANFRVKFVERDKDVDALIVLPDLIRPDGELDDCDLDAVAGGGDGDPTTTPW